MGAYLCACCMLVYMGVQGQDEDFYITLLLLWINRQFPEAKLMLHSKKKNISNI